VRLPNWRATMVSHSSGWTRQPWHAPVPAHFTSPVYDVPGRFTAAIPSWNVVTPRGSWLEVRLRARAAGRWTAWYDLGHWSPQLDSGQRHSVKNQRDKNAQVDTDTLKLKRPADGIQIAVTLHGNDRGALPGLSSLAISTDVDVDDASAAPDNAVSVAADLDVPQLSQRSALSSPDRLGGGGDAWCSPTSVAMVMGYWAEKTNNPRWNVGVETAAQGTYDPVYDGCGNWPFNVAFASEYGLRGWVQRFTDLATLQSFVRRGIPVIASIRAGAGQLTGAPYAKTNGHLLVVRGFTTGGDVIVNDPYGLPGQIRRVYQRAEFLHAWLDGSGGAVYVIAPPAELAEPSH